MLQIKIPQPCHEDWNQMTPTNRGAFCNACAKDVVDFTRMTDEEVQHYLLNKADDKVCGKFNNIQLHRIRINISETVFYSKIAGWKKFMAVVLLAFGSMLFGCDVATDATGKDPVKIEKRDSENQIVGELSLDPILTILDSIAPITCQTTKGEPVYIEQTMGIVAPQFVLQEDIELSPAKPVKEPAYEMVGKVSYVDTSSIKINRKDSLPKIKIPTDSANCGEHFF